MPLSPVGHEEPRVADADAQPIIVARAGATVDTVIAWLKIWMIDSDPITLASDRMDLVGAAARGSRLASRRRVGDAG